MNSFHYEINDIPSKLQGQCQRKATIIANAEQFFYDQTLLPRCHSNTVITFLSTFALPCHCGSLSQESDCQPWLFVFLCLYSLFCLNSTLKIPFSAEMI